MSEEGGRDEVVGLGVKREYFHLRRGRGERVIVSSDFKKLLNVLLKKS